jgi:hypothetical protein
LHPLPFSALSGSVSAATALGRGASRFPVTPAARQGYAERRNQQWVIGKLNSKSGLFFHHLHGTGEATGPPNHVERLHMVTFQVMVDDARHLLKDRPNHGKQVALP